MKFLKLILVVIIIIISFVITFKVLYDKIEIKVDNNTYIDFLVKDTFSNYNLNDIKRLSSTEFLLKYSFGIEKVNTGTNVDIVTPVIKDKEEKNTNSKPKVYIFNTHQTEGYNSNFLEAFNINNTVYLASHILGEYLSDLGVATIVEENSIIDVLNTNGWKYGYSYKASRILLENAYKKNPSLDFFIDLHRDAASYDRTVTEIDGKKYAKILFVVGLEHDSYEPNLQLAKKLNEKIKKIAPTLSRGVLEKKGPGVNGKYNQDFNKNTILIEVGGQYNYIEEVNNTLKIISKVIYEYLEDEKEN
jgi:stage II sporulation protein P